MHRVLSKRRNREVSSYVDFLERRLLDQQARTRNAQVELQNNNTILEKNYEAMVRLLRGMDETLTVIGRSIEEQNGAVDGVSSTSEELTRSSDAILDQMVTQSASLEQFSAVISELTSSIQSVATLSDQGKKISDDVEQALRTASENVQRSQQIVEQVLEASGRIGEIVGLISSISGQSNLLAMNAAIEAAHAGEAGKGFAVVAEEMRNLADNSSTEAKKIQEIVKTIVERINEAASATKDVLTDNERITAEVRKSNDVSAQIKDAMTEQAAGTEEVLQQSRSLADGTSRTKEAAEEQRTANRSLLEAVANLQAIAETVRETLERQTEHRHEIMDVTNKVARSFIRSVDIHTQLSSTAEERETS